MDGADKRQARVWRGGTEGHDETGHKEDGLDKEGHGGGHDVGIGLDTNLGDQRNCK